MTGCDRLAGGDALVYGESLSAAGGMERIRANMGVCPQFDILWGELTGREHMHLYGAIKASVPLLCKRAPMLKPYVRDLTRVCAQ